MAGLPPIRRIAFEDIPGAPSWLKALLTPLNQFTEAVYSALGRQLSFQENFRATIKQIPFRTPTNYWDPRTRVLDNMTFGYRSALTGLATVINTPAIAATSAVLVSRISPGGAPGVLGWSTRIEGVSFTITSNLAGENAPVNWEIFDPLPSDFNKIRFQSGLPRGVPVQGIFPLKVAPSNGGELQRAVSIPSWTEPINGTVQIDFVTGLEASTSYVGTFLVV